MQEKFVTNKCEAIILVDFHKTIYIGLTTNQDIFNIQISMAKQSVHKIFKYAIYYLVQTQKIINYVISV